MSTTAAFAEATVEMEGSQLAGKVTPSPKTTRSRPNAWLTSKWLDLLHCIYRILPRQSSVEKSQSRNGQTPKGTLHSPTPQDFLEGILLEIVGQLKWQRRHGFHEQQQELYKQMASVVMAWTLEKKRSEGISANQPESGKLEEDAEAAEQKRHTNRPSRYRRSSRWQRSRWPSCRHRKKLAEMRTKG